MQINIYTSNDDGDLKLVAEAELDSVDQVQLAVDQILDENPRMKSREFVVIDDANIGTLVVESDDHVNPKRPMTLNLSGSVEADEEDEEEAPAPKRRAKKPAAKRPAKKAPAKKPAAKKAAKRAPAKKPAAKKTTAKKLSKKPAPKKRTGGAFKRNSKGDE